MQLTWRTRSHIALTDSTLSGDWHRLSMGRLVRADLKHSCFVCEVGWIWLANLTEWGWFTWIATATFYSKGHWCWYSTCSFFMKQGLVCSLEAGGSDQCFWCFSSTPLARPKDWSVCQFTCGEGEENRPGKGLQEGSAVTTWSKAVLLASILCTHSNILHSMFTCF